MPDIEASWIVETEDRVYTIQANRIVNDQQARMTYLEIGHGFDSRFIFKIPTSAIIYIGKTELVSVSRKIDAPDNPA